MKKEDVIFNRREFLNMPGQHSTAAILASIEKGGWQSKDRDDEGRIISRNVAYTLSLSDCSRTIY